MISRLLALVGLLLMPLSTMAAGLGKLTVLSGLGQPLRAEIEVVSPQRGEAESLAAKIASPDAFREAGVEYGIVVPRVRTALERRGDRHFIVLTTLQAVEEPFLDLLVELNWATGRLVRQYTFLIDPAEYKGPQPIAAAPPSAPQIQAQAPELPPPSVTAVEPEVQPVAPQDLPAVVATTPAVPFTPLPDTAPAVSPSTRRQPTDRQAYEVKRGDTLSKIALQYRPDGATLQQMLVALFRANEEAFINKNMNLVRAGKILKVPDPAAIEAVAPVDANRIVNAQFQDFSEYRSRLAAQVAAAPTPAAEAQQRSVGRITDRAEERGAPKAPPADQLRISKAEEAAKNAKAAAAARADDLAARERALREANERVADLEKNVRDLQQLLELKNQQLAELQKQAEAAPRAPLAPQPPPLAPRPPEQAAKAPEAPPVPQPPPATAERSDVATAPPTEQPVTPPPAEAPKAEAPPPVPPPPAKKPAPPPPVAEPSFLEAFLEEPLYPAGLGGGILAVLVAGYLWRRKKSARLESSLLGVSTAESSSVFGTTGGRSVDTGGSSLQTDFSQSGIGAIDTDEVDPVAEADVYMAYGRDTQAEEILKEALQKDPNKQAARVKLLEIYAARKDMKGFETTAGEIYAATGGQGPEWQKVVELGQQADPSNPMYGGKTAHARAVAPAPESFVLPAVTAAGSIPAADLALDLGGERGGASIDFDLDAGAKTADVAPDLSLDVVSQAPADLGFDLNLGETEKTTEEASDFSPSGTFIMDPATKKAVNEMVDAKGKSGGLEIDFELPGAPDSSEMATFDEKGKGSMPQSTPAFDFKLDEPAKPLSPVDLSGISFDLGQASQSPAPVDAHWQEVATKLDLAKAYEEMGDRDGARELLNEVIQEGDTAQQQQAKQMLELLH